MLRGLYYFSTKLSGIHKKQKREGERGNGWFENLKVVSELSLLNQIRAVEREKFERSLR